MSFSFSGVCQQAATLVQDGPPDIFVVRCVRFSADGRLLAAAGSGKTILIDLVVCQSSIDGFEIANLPYFKRNPAFWTHQSKIDGTLVHSG